MNEEEQHSQQALPCSTSIERIGLKRRQSAARWRRLRMLPLSRPSLGG